MVTLGAALLGALLYRLRGGLFSNISRAIKWEWGGKQRTQTMRAIWSIPTAGLFAFSLGLSPLFFALMVVSTFVGLAALGHGAHMVFDSRVYIEARGTKTELLTGFWLPKLFGGVPDATWRHARVTQYNLIGMSTIGLARCLISVLPLFFCGETTAALIYAASGALHGALYLAGWRLNGGSQAGECLVGGISWALITNL